MACKNICKLCKNLVLSTDVIYNAPNLQISIPEGAYYDNEKYCIVVAQTIPNTTPVDAPVTISIVNGTQVYPLVNCDCSQVTARQIRTRTKYSTIVHTDATSGTFKLIGNLCNKTEGREFLDGNVPT